jgi:hypothetical protein
LTREEQKDLDYFFRRLLIHDSGVFVLFGSKPLCDSGYLNHVAQRKNSPYRRDLSKGWEAWEKIRPHLKGNRFILVKKCLKIALRGYEYDGIKKYDLTTFTLMDTEKAAKILEENYDFFKECMDAEFNPFEVVREAENPHSIFWSKILEHNSLTYGLLYGFGKRNSVLWSKVYKGQDSDKDAFHCPSESSYAKDEKMGWVHEVFPESVEGLQIPAYVSFEGDEMIEKYREEKAQIKSIYRGKNFLEITLQQFAK